jgi:hypothetical protein
MLWYTDRPNREFGTESVGYFISAWFSSYGEVAPNAMLDGYIGTNVLNDGLFLTLKEPQYDSNSKKLTFNVTVLNSTIDNENPETTLNIEKIKITILNNNDDEQTTAWSFVQIAPDAYFKPTGTDGVYKLYLNDFYPESFYLGNAPNRQSYIHSVKRFTQTWQDRFGDTPPNASMTSYTDNGDIKLQLLTIDNPVYDDDARLLTYTAKLLCGEIENNQTLYSPTLFIDSASTPGERILTFVNECPFPVWIGMNGGAGNLLGGGKVPKCKTDADCTTGQKCAVNGECHWAADEPASGDWKLCAKGKTCTSNTGSPSTYATFTIPAQPEAPGQQGPDRTIVWSGSIFGRTGCDDDGNDCKTARAYHPSKIGVGPVGPITGAEFTLQNDLDFYNVSIINGFNVPMVMAADPNGTYPQEGKQNFWCGNPGAVTYYSKPYPTTDWAGHGCNWEFNPPSSDKYLYTYVADADNADGDKNCTKDSDCEPNEVCGMSYYNLAVMRNQQTTCGEHIGWWSSDEVCVMQSEWSSAPFNCTTAVPPEYGDWYKTLTNLYACHGKDGISCYNEASSTWGAATEKCCGCEDWPDIPATSECVNSNKFWEDNVLPTIEFFKDACPMCYTYPFDDPSSSWQCKTTDTINSVNYTFTFCPDGKTGRLTGHRP